MFDAGPSAFFVRVDADHFRPTEATGGAWSTTEQHISPMNGLITHAVERFCAERGPDGLEISRISVDILGMLGMDPFEVAVSVVRPGRTIELLEAVVTSAGPTAHRQVAVPQPGLDDPSAARGRPAPGSGSTRRWSSARPGTA